MTDSLTALARAVHEHRRIRTWTWPELTRVERWEHLVHPVTRTTARRIYYRRDDGVEGFADRATLEAGRTIRREHPRGVTGHLSLNGDHPLAAEARRLRRLLRDNHPDKGGDEERFRRIYREYAAARTAIREVTR